MSQWSARPSYKPDIYRPRALSNRACNSLQARKFTDGSGKVGVCRSVAGNHTSQARKYMPEIKPVERSNHPARWLRKFQNRSAAARLQHTQNLLQTTLVVRKIPESERARDEIEACIGKGKLQRIRLDKRNARARRGGLGTRSHEHFCNKIRADDFSAVGRLPAKCESQISSATAESRGTRALGSCEICAEQLRNAPALSSFVDVEERR